MASGDTTPWAWTAQFDDAFKAELAHDETAVTPADTPLASREIQVMAAQAYLDSYSAGRLGEYVDEARVSRRVVALMEAPVGDGVPLFCIRCDGVEYSESVPPEYAGRDDLGLCWGCAVEAGRKLAGRHRVMPPRDGATGRFMAVRGG